MQHERNYWTSNGVSFEDVIAVEILRRGKLPPLPNYSKETQDPYLGNIKVSQGGDFNAKYALRFAAGFGSQVSFVLYGVVEDELELTELRSPFPIDHDDNMGIFDNIGSAN